MSALALVLSALVACTPGQAPRPAAAGAGAASQAGPVVLFGPGAEPECSCWVEQAGVRQSGAWNGRTGTGVEVRAAAVVHPGANVKLAWPGAGAQPVFVLTGYSARVRTADELSEADRDRAAQLVEQLQRRELTPEAYQDQVRRLVGYQVEAAPVQWATRWDAAAQVLSLTVPDVQASDRRRVFRVALASNPEAFVSLLVMLPGGAGQGELSLENF
jgi:hypothetical protein